jgi:hypothetical protein
MSEKGEEIDGELMKERFEVGGLIEERSKEGEVDGDRRKR